MKNRFIKLLLAAVLLGSLSPAAAQTREMDLSGEWRFQTDVMDFRRGSLSPRYNHQLQETIMLPGITDDYKIGYKSPYRHVDRLTRVYEYMGPATSSSRPTGRASASSSISSAPTGSARYGSTPRR